MSARDPLSEFVAYARTKLQQNLAQIVRCTGLLTEVELWHRPNEHTNAVGNLLLHLTGNVGQWIVAGVGRRHFPRNRPAEFAERGPRPAAEILARLQQAVADALDVLARLDLEELRDRRSIQGYEVCILVAIFHVTEHFSFHTGQIVHATKALRDVDLSLYDAQGQRRSDGGGYP